MMARGLLMVMACAAMPSLASADSFVFRCYFDWVCDPNRSCTDAGKDIRFRIDPETNAVERLGGNDLSDFSLILGDRAVTILETPISGGATTTTILNADGSAVHSENAIDGRVLAPMQYLGTCVAV